MILYFIGVFAAMGIVDTNHKDEKLWVKFALCVISWAMVVFEILMILEQIRDALLEREI